MQLNAVFNEDCLVTMSKMEDNFLDLTVTSPPYEDLRKYKGYSFEFEKIAKELFRVTKMGGVVVWVVRDKVIKGSESGTSFRQALFFMDIGFRLYDTMIYEKLNPQPLNDGRYRAAFEYMFIFSKGKPSTINLIQTPCKRAGYVGYSETIRNSGGDTLVKKHGSGKPIKKTRPLDNIWRYPVGVDADNRNSKIKHPAIFPEQLAKDHILTWSNEGDIVYDPFIGSGTTAKMAVKNNRRWLGSEISEEYCQLIKDRLS